MEGDTFNGFHYKTIVDMTQALHGGRRVLRVQGPLAGCDQGRVQRQSCLERGSRETAIRVVKETAGNTERLKQWTIPLMSRERSRLVSGDAVKIGSELPVPIDTLLLDGIRPEMGDRVTVEVAGTISSIRDECAYVKLETANDQPIKPSEESWG